MAKSQTERVITTDDLLSTGATPLNLICSGKVKGGIAKGTILHLPGSSDSGKTMLAQTIYAEAANNSAFDDYDFHFWNPEDGSLMDRMLFGPKAKKRLQESQPETLEEFYTDLRKRIKEGTPFIGVLDSMDALYPKEWLKKAEKADRATARGKESAGDMGMQKAKINSAELRRVRSGCRVTGSILIIISQTRDNPMNPYDPQTTAGGRALKFFSTLQIWMNPAGTIYKDYKGKKRAIGTFCKATVKKNHLSGKKGSTTFPIINDYGIDNIGACLDFLVDEGHWKRSSTAKDPTVGKITASEFSDVQVSREKLTKLIEKEGKEKELKRLVKDVFMKIQEAISSKRKPRYG